MPPRPPSSPPSSRAATRHGGSRTARGFEFELSGGAACLDLVNTLDERPCQQPRENLLTYRDLADWGEQTRLVTPAQARVLRLEADKRPAEARRSLARARALRETLFALLEPVARGESPPAEPLAALNRALGRTFARLTLVHEAGGFESRIESAADDLDRLCPPVLQSAFRLLTTSDLARLRCCASETCAWLFLDWSKNGSRRWCDMSVCGNRAKARRHYRRARA